MKKIIFMLVISVALFSCSKESKMETGIREYIEKTAKDPKSYEFVELKATDTLTVAEYAKILIAHNNENQRFCDSLIKNFDRDSKKVVLDYMGQNINTAEKHEQELKDAKQTLKEAAAENLIANELLNSKDVLLYSANHQFRLKNGFGALDLNDMYVFFDKNFQVLDIVQRTEQKYKYRMFQIFGEGKTYSLFKENYLNNK
jgi:hypothetical protein